MPSPLGSGGMHGLISSIRDRMFARQATIARWRDPILWLILCGCFLVSAIFAGTTMMVGEFRERRLANSEGERKNTVRLLPRHFDQQFDDTEVIAADLIREMQVSRIETAAAFREKMSTFDAHEMLKSRVAVLSYVGEVTIFDADGQLINSSGLWPLPDINISQRAYFQTFKNDPQSDAVLAEPLRSFITGGWTTVIGHRLTAADGTFLGVMSRRIDPGSYEKFFASVALGPSAAISLFHTDGTMLARYPHIDELIGKKFKSAPLMKQVAGLGGLQTLRVKSPVDGQDRLGSAAPLTHFPFVVVATNTVEAALSDWRAQTRFMVTAATMSATVVAIILFLIVRTIMRQTRDAQQRLAAEKERLDTALNNMTQGLVLYAAAARIGTLNQRYIDMYNLSRDVVKPGLHYYDLIQHRKDTGSFDGDIRGFCDPIMRHISEGKANSTLMETPERRG